MKFEAGLAGKSISCGKQGGAESHGNGVRPVSSPTEGLRKDKRRSDDSARRERTRPGTFMLLFCFSLYFHFVVSLFCHKKSRLMKQPPFS